MANDDAPGPSSQSPPARTHGRVGRSHERPTRPSNPNKQEPGETAGASPLLVGDHTRAPTGQGAWDSLRIYHEALSANEVRALFRSRGADQ